MLQLKCDASVVAIGAVLEQIVNGEKQPLAFFSEKLDDKKEKWSTYDRELYAIYAATQHFEYLIQGRKLVLYTDHKPLIYMFKQKVPHKLERRSRYVEYVSQFTTDIRHVDGTSNTVADVLSRPEVNVVEQAFSIKDIAEAQKDDEEIIKIRKHGYCEHILKDIIFNNEKISILCSLFRDIERPIIPTKLRYRVFQQLYGLSHPGQTSTFLLISKSYFWPKMKADIKKWVKACSQCQRSKIFRHVKSEIGVFPKSDRSLHVHIDLIIVPYVDGYRYVLTCIDRATRWMEAIPLKDTTAKDVAEAFVTEWISRYGIPEKVTADRGPQFAHTLWKEFTRLLGVDAINTTAYNPKANGVVERFHKTLKEGLRCRGKNWRTDLPWVLLSLRAVPKRDSGVSSAELTFGCKLRLPCEFLHGKETPLERESEYVSKLREAIRRCRPISFKKSKGNNIFIPSDLDKCSKVYVRVDRVKKPLEAPYEGPYEVIKKYKKFFKLKLQNKTDTVSIDRLKPAFEWNPDLESDMEISKKSDQVVSKPKTILKKNSVNDEVSKRKKVTFYSITLNPNINLAPRRGSFSPNVFRGFPESLIRSPRGRRPQNIEAQGSRFFVNSRGRYINPPARYR